MHRLVVMPYIVIPSLIEPVNVTGVVHHPGQLRHLVDQGAGSSSLSLSAVRWRFCSVMSRAIWERIDDLPRSLDGKSSKVYPPASFVSPDRFVVLDGFPA